MFLGGSKFMIKWRTCYAGLCGISSCPYKIRKTLGIQSKYKELLMKSQGIQQKYKQLLSKSIGGTASSSQIGVEPMRDRSRPMRDSMFGGGGGPENHCGGARRERVAPDLCGITPDLCGIPCLGPLELSLLVMKLTVRKERLKI